MTDYEGDIVGIEPYNVESESGGNTVVTPYLVLHVQVSVPLKDYKPESHRVRVSW